MAQSKAAKAMKKAWELFRKAGVRTMEAWRQALRRAWAIVKGLVKEVVNVVELKGTPKQVAWAEDTRKRVLPVLEEVFDGIKNEILEGDARNGLTWVNNIERIINHIKNIDSAKWWIETYAQFLYRKPRPGNGDAEVIVRRSEDFFKEISIELGIFSRAHQIFSVCGLEYLYNKEA